MALSNKPSGADNVDDTYDIGLRVFHPTLSTKAICDAIGVSPEFAFQIGEPRGGRHTKVVWLENYCCFDMTPRDEMEPEQALGEVLDQLIIKADFFKEVTQTEGRAYLMMNLFLESLSALILSPSLLSMLSRCNIPFEMCFYPQNEFQRQLRKNRMQQSSEAGVRPKQEINPDTAS